MRVEKHYITHYISRFINVTFISHSARVHNKDIRVGRDAVPHTYVLRVSNVAKYWRVLEPDLRPAGKRVCSLAKFQRTKLHSAYLPPANARDQLDRRGKGPHMSRERIQRTFI